MQSQRFIAITDAVVKIQRIKNLNHNLWCCVFLKVPSVAHFCF